MLILVVNCGSSSVKYDLFDIDGESSDLARGAIERIGDKTSILVHEVQGRQKHEEEIQCPDHYRAIEVVRDMLTDPDKGVLSSVDEVIGVGHRVVHGGEEFNDSIVINDAVINSIEKYSELAPLHNPPSLEGIRSCMEIFQDVPQVAVFDTAFHHSMEQKAYFYAIPYEYYEKHRIRRYGFHGTSHRYVANETANILGRPLKDLKIITAHLGNGCSISAVSDGKSVDTSMGFTPLEGLVMGTRSGDIDPAIVSFIMQRENLTSEEVTNILNKKSGLLGVSGISNDMRDLLDAIEDGNDRAKLAYDVFVYRILKYIGSYAAVLGKVDAVVFTAGIGENVKKIKDDIQDQLRGLFGKDTQFLNVGTNEELLIAKDTYKIISEINK